MAQDPLAGATKVFARYTGGAVELRSWIARWIPRFNLSTQRTIIGIEPVVVGNRIRLSVSSGAITRVSRAVSKWVIRRQMSWAGKMVIRSYCPTTEEHEVES